MGRRSNSYAERGFANRNGRNHSVGSGVEDRSGVVSKIHYVGSGSIRRDRYPARK